MKKRLAQVALALMCLVVVWMILADGLSSTSLMVLLLVGIPIIRNELKKVKKDDEDESDLFK